MGRLLRGGTFNIKRLADNARGTLAVPPLKLVWLENAQTEHDQTPPSSHTLIVPPLSTSPAVDFIAPPRWLFRIAVRASHPVNAERLAEVIASTLHADDAPVLFFVVPGDMLSGYSKQVYHDHSGHVIPRIDEKSGEVVMDVPATVKGVEQYALSIPFDELEREIDVRAEQLFGVKANATHRVAAAPQEFALVIDQSGRKRQNNHN